MSSYRQRILDALHYNSPDKIPVIYHPSPAGLYVHGKKLLDLFNEFAPDNPIAFEGLPTSPPHSLNKRGEYREIHKDEWGTERESLIFGIQGHPKGYPFVSWREAADYVFPPVPQIDAARIDTMRRTHLVVEGGISIFEKLQSLRPAEDVFLSIMTEDADFMAFFDRLIAYWQQCIQAYIGAGTDAVFFGDDWGSQAGPLIDPARFRAIFKPRYNQLMHPIKKAGRKIFFHCCGNLGVLFDDLLELGIDCLWPQIVPFDAEPEHIDKCRQRRAAVYIHPDRQRLIPLGTPQEIEDAVGRYAERYHRLGGGGIFYIEIENDAPFENVDALIRSVHKYRTA